MAHNTRNFSIIAHIDHGKTTLTDALLRTTHSVAERDFKERMMDSNPIERERGITIKLAPVTMQYAGPDGKPYTLNLIDTPGHVDFSYEVSRSLAACEGALLVVDATQGIQAQTLSTYEQARLLGLTIIPVLNKIDLPTAEPERVMLELMELTGCGEEEIISVSAKSGKNVDILLDAIVTRVPAPTGDAQVQLRALLITSHFDQHRGAIGMVRVIDGTLKAREQFSFVIADQQFQPLEIGIFDPQMHPVESLSAGDVGYLATGLKDIRLLKVGDTLTHASSRKEVEPLAGYREPSPMVFMELYPVDTAEFTLLTDAIEKLVLRDAALQYTGTHSPALGSGFRVGFLGILHAEIVLERFSREFGLELIATLPTVTYELTDRVGEVTFVQTPADMPDPTQIAQVREPIALLKGLLPRKYVSVLLQEVRERRGEFIDSEPVGERVRVQCRVPLAELITDFHDVIKSKTSGYASVEYALESYAVADVVKVAVLLNKEPIDALSFLTVREQAQQKGRAFVSRLKEVVPRQMFELPIQATIGGTVIARETVKAFRKDVTAKLYGGDVTRRKKLLAKQAKGKKRMKQFGKVELDSKTFMDILRTNIS